MKSAFRIVCLIDDDPEYHDMMRSALDMIEERIHTEVDMVFFSSSKDVIEQIYLDEKFPADIILLDINMPARDGFDVLKIIRDNPRHKTIPIIMLTSSAREADIKKSYELGANSFITKPSGLVNLLHMMVVLIQYWFEICSIDC